MYKSIANQIVGTKVYHFEEIDSTNDYASYLLSKKSPSEGTVISADAQMKGKGQYGRKWLANKGENITLSVILYPNLPVHDQFLLNIFTALAVKDCLEKCISLKPLVKWPNDIYIDNSKIAGILIQNFISGTSINTSIIGIGLNVNQREFTSEANNATSISIINEDLINLEEVKSFLYKSLDLYYFLLKANPDQLKIEYVQNLYGLQETRQFEIADCISNGVIQGIDGLGRLVVHIDQENRAFSMGEIKMIVN
jgi:BirA family transcriptional regulator, biotin operon repressor / biotin---[acetyl-CoA-carboxylase] ligase